MHNISKYKNWRASRAKKHQRIFLVVKKNRHTPIWGEGAKKNALISMVRNERWTVSWKMSKFQARMDLFLFAIECKNFKSIGVLHWPQWFAKIRKISFTIRENDRKYRFPPCGLCLNVPFGTRDATGCMNDRPCSRLASGKVFFGSRKPARPFWGDLKSQLFFLDGRYLNSTFLSGRVCEQHGCTAKHVHSYGAQLIDVYVFTFCTQVYTST